jgi:hypothetical protein
MSESTKPNEASRKPQDAAAKVAQPAIDAAKVAQDSVGQTASFVDAAADRARQAGQTMTETAAETAAHATNTSARAVASSRDAMLLGMRTAAGVSGKVADISFDRGHHILSNTAQAMDIYTDAAERSAERVQALVTSAMVWTRGIQKMQHAWLEMIDHSMERASHRPQDLLRCKNLVELAEVQRELYTDAVNHVFESSSKLLDLASRAAQDAVRPLQAH